MRPGIVIVVCLLCLLTLASVGFGLRGRVFTPVPVEQHMHAGEPSSPRPMPPQRAATPAPANLPQSCADPSAIGVEGEVRLRAEVTTTDSLGLPGLEWTDIEMSLAGECGDDWFSAYLNAENGFVEAMTEDEGRAARASPVKWTFAVSAKLSWQSDEEWLRLDVDSATPTWRGNELVFAVTVDSSTLLDQRLMLRGRLTGIGGHVFANAEFGLVAPLGFSSRHMNSLDTGPGGEFIVVVGSSVGLASDADLLDEGKWDPRRAGDMQTLATGPWFVEFGSHLDDRDGEREWFQTPMPAPVLRGRVFDFGDVRLRGELLQVEVKPFAEGDDVSISLTSGGFELECRRDKPVWDLVLPAGLYRYHGLADITGLESEHLTFEGEIEVIAGKANRLSLNWEHLEFVSVTVRDPQGQVVDAEVDAKWYFGERYASYGYQAPLGQCQVLTSGRSRLQLKAEATNAEGVWVDVLPGTTAIELRVDPVKPAGKMDWEPTYGRVKLLYSMPAAIKDTPAALFESPTASPVWQSWGRDTYLEQWLVPGRWTATLYGGASWGYPQGKLCEPVEFSIEAGQELSIEMPPIEPPSWESRRRLQWQFTCGGQTVNLRASLRTISGEHREMSDSPHAESYPLALMDGEQEIPLTGKLLETCYAIGAELPVRVNAKLAAGLPPQEYYCLLFADRTSCSVANLGPGGSASLWLPAGPARIRLWSPQATIEREVIVPSTGTLEVELNSDALAPVVVNVTGVNVALESGYSQFDLSLFRAEGRAYRSVMFGNKIGAPNFLLPGRYRIVATGWKYAGETDFTVTPGESANVEIKLRAVECGGTLLVPEPPGESPRSFWVLPARLQQLAAGLHTTQLAQDVYARRVQGGLLLSGLPVGEALLVTGNGSSQWLLTTQITLEPGKQAVAGANWVAMRELDGDWYSYDLLVEAGPNAVAVPVDGALPTGPVRLRFRDGKVDLVWDLVVNADEEDLPLPGNIQEDLRRAGMNPG